MIKHIYRVETAPIALSHHCTGSLLIWGLQLNPTPQPQYPISPASAVTATGSSLYGAGNITGNVDEWDNREILPIYLRVFLWCFTEW